MNRPMSTKIPLLELDLLRTLVAIAEHGNFSLAAEAVNRTPSAVSMQVKRMEELLERPVFVRDSRSVRLTQDGDMLLEHGRRLLALNRDVMSRFLDPGLSGEVRLGTPDDLAERFMPAMLRRFADTHPGIAVNVVVDGSQRMNEKLNEGRLDIAIVTCGAGHNRSEPAEVLLEEQLVWAVAKGGICAEQTPLPISVWEEGCIWRKAAIEKLENQGRPYRIAFQSAHISAQRAAILADLAVAPIPQSSLTSQIVKASPELKLPELPAYALGMLMVERPSDAVLAAADHLRAAFAKL